MPARRAPRHHLTMSKEHAPLPSPKGRRRADGVPLRAAGPGPAKTERPSLLHGHDSLHDVLRSDDRGQRTDQTVYRALPRSRTRGPDDSRPAAEDGARAICPLPSAFCHLNLVGLGRLERPTSRLSGVRSNQLSYRPERHPAGPGTRAARAGRCPNLVTAGPHGPTVVCEGTCRRRRAIFTPGDE